MRLEEAIQEKKELAMEFVAIKQNYMNLNDDFLTARDKAEKLSLELLNLVNSKSSLEAQNAELQESTGLLRSRAEEVNRTRSSHLRVTSCGAVHAVLFFVVLALNAA